MWGRARALSSSWRSVFARMSQSAFVCEWHSVWHDRRWPSLCVLHPIAVMACRTQVSVVMVTVVIDSFSVPGRQICGKCFPLLSGLFPSDFYGEVLNRACYSAFPLPCVAIFNLYSPVDGDWAFPHIQTATHVDTWVSFSSTKQFCLFSHVIWKPTNKI